MTRRLLLATLFTVAAVGIFKSPMALAEDTYPQPAGYAVSWELKFEHGTPKRTVVESTNAGTAPVAYWYMTYTVTNPGDQERTFLPFFQMVSRTGEVIRSDTNIPQRVFDQIKQREGDRFLEMFTKVGGELRLGEDEAKTGVAIWKEPDPRMGNFTIFVGGLSGEAVQMKDDKGALMKDPDGQPIILHKMLQLNYIIRGDEVYPGQDEINQKSQDTVMR